MKTRIKTIALMAAAAFITACSVEEQKWEVGTFTPATLTVPDDGATLTLYDNSVAATSFEWTLDPACGQATSYVIFYDADGNEVFSSPSTTGNSVRLSLADMKMIGNLAKVGEKKNGTVQWAVRSLKGSQKVLSDRRSFVLPLTTDVLGEDAVPENLYLTGEATEYGADIAGAKQLTNLGNGKFEIYTELTGTKNFTIVSDKTASAQKYSVGYGTFSLSDKASNVPVTGVYRISVDFAAGTGTVLPVSIQWYIPWGGNRITLNYMGDREWSATGVKVNNDNSDNRYKFIMIAGSKQYDYVKADESMGDRGPDATEATDPTAAYWQVMNRGEYTGDWSHDRNFWKTDNAGKWSKCTFSISFTLNPDGTGSHYLERTAVD